MPLWLIILLIVVVVAIIIRWTIRGAIFERLPIDSGEPVLLEEEGLKVFHKIRKATGGQSLTYKVRSVLTDGRILVATGGPEGKHKFFMKMIIDFKTPAPQVQNSGYGAYREKFHLENGYPTYYITAQDVSLVEKRGQTAVRIEVPFPEHGSFYENPEVIIYSKQPETYRTAIAKQPSLNR